MYQEKRLLCLLVETPLHVGSGSDLGVIDLPIQRERHTGFPKVEGSSLKGCLRETFETRDESITFNNLPVKNEYFVHSVFGPEDTDDTFISAIAVTDARLLLFPVKSMRGIFAWITCPRVLQQFKKDLIQAGVDIYGAPKDADKSDDAEAKGVRIPDKAGRIENCDLLMPKSSDIILEEYLFSLNEDSDLKEFAKWVSENLIPQGPAHQYWRDKIQKDIVVLDDDEFADFVNLSTEVITRIKIDNDTGTVADGQLFTEEFLPTDSLLYSLVLTSPLFNKKKEGIFSDNNKNAGLVMDYLETGLSNTIIQLGGDATIGKGLISPKLVEVNNE